MKLLLYQKEVQFLVQLIRERFDDVCTLGRDFVRLLMSVASIPEIEELWQEMLLVPSTLEQLMQMKTPNRF